MVSGINNVGAVSFQPQMYQNNKSALSAPLDSFDVEDKAIISSEAKMLNSLDKYNSGQGDEIDLAVTRVTSENQVSAEVNVINAKKHMIDSILDLGK